MTASTEEDAVETKATFIGYPKLGWEKGDQISLLGTQTGNQPLTASSRGNTTEFTGYADVTDEIYYALYPYDANVTVDASGNLSGVVIPDVQTATAGTFDPKAYVAIAKSEDKESLQFKAIGTFIKFSLKEFPAAIKSITLMGNKNEVLAGKAGKTYFNADGGTAHSGIATADAAYSVKLQGTFDISKAYFMIIRPQPYTEGVTVYVELENGKVLSRKGTKNLFESGQARNSILTLTLDPKYFTEVNDLYALYELGYDINVGGKTFNKTNCTATHITSSGTSKGINAAGVYFVDPDVEGVSMNTGYSNLAIIGTNPSVRSTVSRSGGYYKIGATSSNDDYFILSGINFTVNPSGTYSIRVEGKNTCETICINNCAVTVPSATQFIYADKDNFVKNILIKDSEFLVQASSSNNFINFVATQSVDAITFDNNVFYSADIAAPSTAFTLISASNTTVTDLLLNKNTFYGAYPSNEGGNIINSKATNMTVTNNMFGLNQQTNTNNVFVMGAKISDTMNFSNNAYYKVNSTKGILTVGNSNAAPSGTNETISSKGISTSGWNPAEGKFVINSSYGATR